MLINIDSMNYSQKPTGANVGVLVPRLKKKENIQDLTLEQLKDEILKGKTITAAAMSGTKESDWASQQVFIFDIDNEAKTLSKMLPTDVEKLFSDNNIPILFMYYTFSHKEDHPKFRVVTACDEVITDPEEAKKIILSVMNLFPKVKEESTNGKFLEIAQIDLSCKNLDRIFFGTNQGLVNSIGSNTLFKKQTILDLYKDPKEIKGSTLPSLAIVKYEANNRANSKLDLKKEYDDFDVCAYLLSNGCNIARRTAEGVILNPCPICGQFILPRC